MENPNTWTATAEAINALPDPIRHYIHQALLTAAKHPYEDCMADDGKPPAHRPKTLCDEFAIAALMAMADSVRPNAVTGHDNVARAAYAYANAMMKARDQ